MKINGNKSYMGAIAFGAFGLAVNQGWIPAEYTELGYTMIASFFGFSIAHKINKAKK